MNWQRVFIHCSIRTIFILSLIFSSYSSLFPNPEEDGKISGYIFNASHQPLVGVEVRAVAYNGAYFHRMSYSAEDGSYVIDQLPVGQYYLRVQNKLGYLNVYYDNVIDKSDATLIKVNTAEHVTNINFYLERSGFISGHIYDSDGNALITNTSIGFFNAENFNSHGFINGNPDGTYISPGLPNCPHIVKASALPSGFVMTYYENVSTQDSARIVHVTPSDTVKNIDFFLQKGGAISGYVRGEDPEKPPISEAWVVVTNWENGEWSSENCTDSTGYYCAAGLRAGAYRVFVYGIDPLKYHNEYYQNSPQYENASKVMVGNQDTTKQINFTLQPVKRVLLSNEYIEIAVSDRYPGTNLSIGITGGLPETPFDNNKPILFGHPYPYTSFTTIRIDGEKLVFGSNDGLLIDDPYRSSDGKNIGRRWDYQKIAIVQKITLVESKWSETKYEDTAQIQYIITNNDNVPHEVGVRILFDTMLGKDDAALIRTSNSIYTGYEQDFYYPDIPGWWTAIELDKDETVFSVQGTLKNYGAIVPDRFSIVNWSNIFKSKWEYQTNNDLGVIKDSGVALWWNPITIKPGDKRIVCTFVGLGEMYPDKEPPYTSNHLPAKDSKDVELNTNIQLEVLDDYMGVDSSTIVMLVNGDTVTPRIEGNLQRYTLYYDPPNDFRYNDTVNVIVEAADLAIKPNFMKPDTYQFYITRDTLPPFITNLYPEPQMRNIPPDTCLSFILGDNHSGVDKNSINVFINGNSKVLQLEGTPNKFSVRYLFQPSFGEMDSVTVRIQAIDQVTPANGIDSTFYFIVAKDSIAPWVEFYHPQNLAKEIKLDTTIKIELVDDFTGIDRSSIKLQLDSVLVTPEIRGDSCRYFISYRPDNGFRYNEKIAVILNAHDLAKIPNRMAPFIFSFSTETDTTPPSIALLTPLPNDTNVNPTPLIVLEIKDDKAGVDSDSIRIWINGDAVKFSLTGNLHHYQISYYPQRPFDYLKWITVAVFAQDKSNPPNVSDTSTFRFRIMKEKDISPPYTTLYQPSKGSFDVAPNCSISFHVRDDLSGVDSSSISLKVNGLLVKPIISGNVQDYKIVYIPVNPFWYGQQVLLEIDAKDLAKDSPNVMTTDSCLFTIMFDTSPPEIIWKEPGQPDEHIPLDSEFIADIIDSLTGVDINLLKFKFQGEIIYPQIDCNQNYCHIRYKPGNRLKYNQQIEFIITGCDLATPPNWIRDSLFTFYTIEDHEPPYITGRDPEKNEVGVPFDTDIIVYINDDIAGVDEDSIKMTIDGRTVIPIISGNPNRLQLSYKNPIDFRPGQEVVVTIDAVDLSNPPNRMERETYSFFIKDVYPDLFIKSFTLDHSRILVHKSIPCNATIGVKVAPVFDLIQIKVWDNDFIIIDTTLSPMSMNESVDISRTVIFNRKGRHQLKLSIDPENKIIEFDEENNSAIRVIEVFEGEIIVRSNPFTPNGDGINDEVTFNFEQLGVIDPLLKLFDVSGRIIATIRDRKGYKFIWDGQDRYGNPAQPGVYLYMLQDEDKTIANGYVVLAR